MRASCDTPESASVRWAAACGSGSASGWGQPRRCSAALVAACLSTLIFVAGQPAGWVTT
jgi:hypothetical protein